MKEKNVSKTIPDHRRYVEVGKSYDFQTIAIRQISSGMNIVMMEYVTPDGEVVPLFGVKPFAFQEEGGLTPVIRCYVQGFRPNGIALLVQDREWLLNLLYRDAVGTVASFTITKVSFDSKTQAMYYELRDVFGVSSHRFYPGRGAVSLAVGQQIELGIKALNGKFIELASPDELSAGSRSSQPPVVGRFGGEDSRTEFKSSIVFSAATDGGIDPDYQLGVIAKGIAAFLNAEGGTLYIGVDDSGTLKGVADDMPHLNEGTYDEYNGSYKPTPDGYELKVRNAVKRMLGNTANGLLSVKMLQEEGLIYCKVDVQPSPEPIYWGGVYLYQRAGNQKQQLKGSEITTFVKLRMADQIREYMSTGPSFGTIVPSDRQIAPATATTVSSGGETVVWNHFTWYENGEFSIQKEAVAGDGVKLQVSIPKGCENERLVFCYANGCVNMVVPAKIRANKTVRKRYKLPYCSKSELLAVFPARSYDLLAIASRNSAGREFVKCHPLTDIGVTGSMSAQGASVIPTNGKQGDVIKFVKLDIAEKNVIPNLVFQRNQTTASIGVDINDVRHAEEIKYLLRHLS